MAGGRLSEFTWIYWIQIQQRLELKLHMKGQFWRCDFPTTLPAYIRFYISLKTSLSSKLRQPGTSSKGLIIGLSPLSWDTAWHGKEGLQVWTLIQYYSGGHILLNLVYWKGHGFSQKRQDTFKFWCLKQLWKWKKMPDAPTCLWLKMNYLILQSCTIRAFFHHHVLALSFLFNPKTLLRS